jgi:cell division protein ZapA (FtsZ GTPase activity inhibitor)
MPEEKGIMYELLNVDADKASEEKLRALVKHLQGQMRPLGGYNGYFDKSKRQN